MRITWLPYLHGTMQGWRSEQIWGNKDEFWRDFYQVVARYHISATEVPVYSPGPNAYGPGYGVVGWFIFATHEPTIPPDEQETDQDRAAEARWTEIFHDPDAIAVMEELAQEALAEHKAGLTRDLDDLLTESDE